MAIEKTQLASPSQANSPLAPSNTADKALNDQATAVSKKSKRTPGLWIYDALLYPLLNNTAVFIISVAATYLTIKGGNKDKDGKLIYGKIGQFFQKRGDNLMHFFENTLGMNHKSADMSKMVFFSFFDGTFVAPFIKVLEDRRENFAEKIDIALGTRSDDPTVYEAEPKQSWSSVVGGRLATAAIVVPTAVALDKLHIKDKNDNFVGLNDMFFTRQGEKLGKLAEKKGWFQKFAQKHDMQQVARVSVFEAFYTSVCTAGLYISSRFFARKQGEHKAATPQPEKHSFVPQQPTAPEPDPQQPQPAIASAAKTPTNRVEKAQLVDRIESLPAHAVGA